MPLGAAYLGFPSAVAPAAMVIAVALITLPLLRAPVYLLVHSGVFAERVLVIGTGPLARRALEAAEHGGRGRCVIVGVVDDETDADDAFVPPDERLGPLSRLDRIIETTRPDRIVMALAERRRRLPIPPLLDARLRGIMIEDGAAFYERLTGKIAIEALTPSSLIFSQDFRMPRAVAGARAGAQPRRDAGRPRRAGPRHRPRSRSRSASTRRARRSSSRSASGGPGGASCCSSSARCT